MLRTGDDDLGNGREDIIERNGRRKLGRGGRRAEFDEAFERRERRLDDGNERSASRGKSNVAEERRKRDESGFAERGSERSSSGATEFRRERSGAAGRFAERWSVDDGGGTRREGRGNERGARGKRRDANVERV